jgi:hypothetical protein
MKRHVPRGAASLEAHASYRVRGRLCLAGVIAIAMSAVLAAPSPSRAQEKVVISGGGDVDNASDGYLGATVALSHIGEGLAVRGSGFGGAYDYRGGPANQRIDATFAGAELDLIYQFANDGFWINGGVGGRYVDTTLHPNDPGNRRRGSQGEVALVVDGGDVSGPWRGDWYAGYGTRLDDYQARVSLTHALDAPWRAGLEVGAEGDPTYNEQRVGPLVAYAFSKSGEVQVSGGFSDGSVRGPSGYLRVGFYSGF